MGSGGGCSSAPLCAPWAAAWGVIWGPAAPMPPLWYRSVSVDAIRPRMVMLHIVSYMLYVDTKRVGCYDGSMSCQLRDWSIGD